eukprot:m.334844 g.334844  ORF g.334844 m.334844 type:complete len:56 (+) comp19787_c1_seq12:2838-3005(+)
MGTRRHSSTFEDSDAGGMSAYRVRPVEGTVRATECLRIGFSETPAEQLNLCWVLA